MIVDWIEKHQFSCVIKSNLGFECPGCGTQRAFIALLRGDVLESLSIHPGVLLFLITFFVVIVQIFAQFKRGGWVVLFLFVLSITATMVNYVLKFFY